VTHSDADVDVIRDVRRGSRDAYAQLVERYHGRLFGLVLMMVRNRAAAEEVTQDAFVRAYTHLDAYETHRPFYPWIATIAVRLSQNWLRHHTRTSLHEADWFTEATASTASLSALDDLIQHERSEDLWCAVAALPSGERTAVFLYYRDEMPVRDIARALGVTSGTVKTLLFRARRHLRERLGKAGLKSCATGEMK
jgi:RNA polymerase sigma-70 factor (ECF subfamily)